MTAKPEIDVPIGEDQASMAPARSEIGDGTRISLGTGTRVTIALLALCVAGLGAYYREIQERSQADTELELRLARQIEAASKATQQENSAMFVSRESSDYRYAQLSEGLRSAINDLNKDIGFLRRDVSGMNEFVKEIPSISAQLRVLQDRKQ